MADDPLRFIQVGELVKGISEGTLPADDSLAGRTLTLAAEDGTVTRLSFGAAGALTWEVTSGPAAGERGEEMCLITRPRTSIVVVDYVASARRATASPSCSTSSAARRPRSPGRCRPRSRPLAAHSNWRRRVRNSPSSPRPSCQSFIDGPWADGAHPHVPTDALVGKRVQYVYSQTEAYEHIYLNENLYTWQCLRGSEAGLADTDRCHYRRIADELYLFVWREKVVPTLGVVLVDWAAKRSNGRIFGYEGSDFEALSTTPISSHATLLNVTTYA